MEYEIMHEIANKKIDIPVNAIGITVNVNTQDFVIAGAELISPNPIIAWLEPVEEHQPPGRNVTVDLHDILDLLTMYDGGGPMPSDIFDIISDCNIQDVKEYTNKLKAESEEGTADEVLEMFIGYTTDLEMRKHRVIK